MLCSHKLHQVEPTVELSSNDRQWKNHRRGTCGTRTHERARVQLLCSWSVLLSVKVGAALVQEELGFNGMKSSCNCNLFVVEHDERNDPCSKLGSDVGSLQIDLR